jgi:hypothetical protein
VFSPAEDFLLGCFAAATDLPLAHSVPICKLIPSFALLHLLMLRCVASAGDPGPGHDHQATPWAGTLSRVAALHLVRSVFVYPREVCPVRFPRRNAKGPVLICIAQFCSSPIFSAPLTFGSLLHIKPFVA